jgi:glycosyltransferase 2 family protein
VSQASKRPWAIVLVAVLVLSVLVWLGMSLWNRGFDWGRFVRVFKNLDYAWLAAAVALALATYPGRALRWRVLIAPQKPDASVWKLTVATAIGFTAIVVFGRPGEMVRPYLIAKMEKLTFTSQIGAWLLERIYDLLMALLIFGFALSQVQATELRADATLQGVLKVGGYFVGGLSAICIVVLFLLSRYSEAMERRLKDALTFLPDAPRMRVYELITSFVHGVSSAKTGSYVLKILGYSVLEWFLIVGSYYCMIRSVSLPIQLGIIDIAIFVGFISFGAVVQVPGIGGGMQIVTIVVLTELFQVSLEAATGLALLLWMITFVVIVPFGLFLAFREGVSLARLKRVSGELS